MVTRSVLTTALVELQTMLIQMGVETEKALRDVVQALIKHDVESAHLIIASDVEINKIEERIVNAGIKLIATQQPVAKDLRRIIAALKISSDLERIADLSVDIAKVVIRLDYDPLIEPLMDISRMTDITINMINESIQAYLTEDVNLAYKMAKDDDDVDAIYSNILKNLFNNLTIHPETINQTMMLGFVGRYVERIADHATNIGEQAVYLVEGKRPELNV